MSIQCGQPFEVVRVEGTGVVGKISGEDKVKIEIVIPIAVYIHTFSLKKPEKEK